MDKLIQAKVSRKVLQYTSGEITERELKSFIDGVNMALSNTGKYFNYSPNESTNSYGIKEGTAVVTVENRNSSEEESYNDGFSTVAALVNR